MEKFFQPDVIVWWLLMTDAAHLDSGIGDDDYQALSEREEKDLERLLAQSEDALSNAEKFMEQLTRDLSILDGVSSIFSFCCLSYCVVREHAIQKKVQNCFGISNVLLLLNDSFMTRHAGQRAQFDGLGDASGTAAGAAGGGRGRSGRHRARVGRLRGYAAPRPHRHGHRWREESLSRDGQSKKPPTARRNEPLSRKLPFWSSPL